PLPDGGESACGLPLLSFHPLSLPGTHRTSPAAHCPRKQSLPPGHSCQRSTHHRWRRVLLSWSPYRYIFVSSSHFPDLHVIKKRQLPVGNLPKSPRKLLPRIQKIP